MARKGRVYGRWGKPISVKASAEDDGVVVKSDSTELDYDALYIEPGVTGNVIISRDGGTSTTTYEVSGPQTLAVSGNRVMNASTYTGGNIIWQQWGTGTD